MNNSLLSFLDSPSVLSVLYLRALYIDLYKYGMCSHDHMIVEDVLWFIPVDPSQNSSSSQLNLSVLIKQMLMETLWVERKRSFNSCPVHEPLNWLGELNWLSSTLVFLGVPVQNTEELEEEQREISEEKLQIHYSAYLGRQSSEALAV